MTCCNLRRAWPANGYAAADPRLRIELAGLLKHAKVIEQGP
jgi:hypothetical protein